MGRDGWGRGVGQSADNRPNLKQVLLTFSKQHPASSVPPLLKMNLTCWLNAE